VSFKLYLSKGVQSTLELESTEANLAFVFRQIMTRTSEIAPDERQSGQGAATRTGTNLKPQSDGELTSPFQARGSDEEWVRALADQGTPLPEPDEKRSTLVAHAFCNDAWAYTAT